MPKLGDGVFINHSKKTIKVHYWSRKGVYYTKQQLLEGMKPEIRKEVEEAMKKKYKWK